MEPQQRGAALLPAAARPPFPPPPPAVGDAWVGAGKTHGAPRRQGLGPCSMAGTETPSPPACIRRQSLPASTCVVFHIHMHTPLASTCVVFLHSHTCMPAHVPSCWHGLVGAGAGVRRVQGWVLGGARRRDTSRTALRQPTQGRAARKRVIGLILLGNVNNVVDFAINPTSSSKGR